MGYEEGVAPEPFAGLIDEVLTKAGQYCDINAGYVIRDNIHVNKISKSLTVDGIDFNIHRIISNQIKRSEKIAFFLCTAGQAIGEWAKSLMKSGDMIKGYVVDVVGSETVDSAMDLIQDRMESELDMMGLKITERYSPGYCSWRVDEQQKLFTFFPDNYCGIRLSPSSLMDPIKSISGIIGIGKDVKRNGYACNMCDMKECIYRNKRHVKS
jgi:hypothetical protein